MVHLYLVNPIDTGTKLRTELRRLLLRARAQTGQIRATMRELQSVLEQTDSGFSASDTRHIPHTPHRRDQ